MYLVIGAFSPRGGVLAARNAKALLVMLRRNRKDVPIQSCQMESLLMGTMQSLEIPADRIASVRQMIPVGIEHYVVARNPNGFSYINLRTDDHGLVRRLMEAGRA